MFVHYRHTQGNHLSSQRRPVILHEFNIREICTASSARLIEEIRPQLCWTRRKIQLHLDRLTAGGNLHLFLLAGNYYLGPHGTRASKREYDRLICEWLAAEIEATGIRLSGADITVYGEIPIGGGLSSSASLELAMATAMLGIAGKSMGREEMARACRRAEQVYGGVNCGIMDQFSVACCERGHAMLLDCRTLATKSVTIPPGIALLLTDSGVKHRLSESGYNNRADQCREAVEILRANDPAIAALRDVTPNMLDACAEKLGDLLLQRCRHVVTEIQRTEDAFSALGSGDIDRLGDLVQHSHASLRDDFDVSCNEIESLVAIADACDGVVGSRMVGAGFGGCVLSVVRREQLANVRRQIAEDYGAVSGATPWMHAVSPAGPAEEVLPQ